MRKKFLLTFVMVAMCLGVQAIPFEVDGVWYDYVNSEQKECFVTGAPYGETSRVVCITNYAFRDCKELVSVEIPPTVNRIYNYAFQGSGIQKITIPSTVTTLQGLLFVDCDKLRRVVIEENPYVRSLDNQMFLNCSSLEEVVFFSNIRKFGDECFKGSNLSRGIYIVGGRKVLLKN